MKLPPPRVFALVIAVALGFTGCASTRIVNQWSNPDYATPRLRKILVIGVSRQPSIRRTFEDEFVTNRTFSTHRGNRQFFAGRGLQGCVNTTETISNPL